MQHTKYTTDWTWSDVPQLMCIRVCVCITHTHTFRSISHHTGALKEQSQVILALFLLHFYNLAKLVILPCSTHTHTHGRAPLHSMVGRPSWARRGKRLLCCSVHPLHAGRTQRLADPSLCIYNDAFPRPSKSRLQGASPFSREHLYGYKIPQETGSAASLSGRRIGWGVEARRVSSGRSLGWGTECGLHTEATAVATAAAIMATILDEYVASLSHSTSSQQSRVNLGIPHTGRRGERALAVFISPFFPFFFCWWAYGLLREMGSVLSWCAAAVVSAELCTMSGLSWHTHSQPFRKGRISLKGFVLTCF